MKRTKNYILILLIFLSFGCNDFLEETSGDLLIPTKVDEFAPLLYKEGYPCKFNREAGWFKLMTDDVEMSYLEKSSSSSSDNSIDFDLLNGGEGKYAFTWDYNMEEYITDAFWTARYNNILGCNAIIQALPKMKYNEDEKGKYMYLAAQAYALRAYHYFCLINTYALPYSTEHLQSPGVIIRTSPEINIEPQKRASIEEVWTLINSDIKSAIEYMEKSIPSTNPHLLSPAAIWLLASRIALFQEKWDKVIEYGKMFLSETNFIFDLNNVDEDKMGKSSPDDFFIMNIETNNEIIFTFGDGNQYYEYLSMPTSLYNLGFRVSYQSETSLLKMYDESDLRLKAYFMQDYIEKSSFPWIPDEKKYCYHYPIKFKSSKKGYFENWRTVEVFLNLSEAYARNQKEISNEALDLINQLRSKRIKTDKFVPLSKSTFKSKEDFIKFIWNERRRELCFEEIMRFWDLRRTGMQKIEHRWYSDKDNYELYVLEHKGNNYTVQIPRSETMYNDLVTPNKRDVITPK